MASVKRHDAEDGGVRVAISEGLGPTQIAARGAFLLRLLYFSELVFLQKKVQIRIRKPSVLAEMDLLLGT